MEMVEAEGDMAVPAMTPASSVTIVAAADTHGYTGECVCGCASCHGSIAPAVDFTLISMSGHTRYSQPPVSLWATARVPLVPPPQPAA
jgi:hypothetical protein